MGLIPAITMATYTTYKLIMASIHIQKQKHNNHNNVLVTELRTINFIDALVSILTLQNTLIMVNQTKSSANDMFVLSAVSSAAIYIVIMFTTIHLLRKGFRQRKKALRLTKLHFPSIIPSSCACCIFLMRKARERGINLQN